MRFETKVMDSQTFDPAPNFLGNNPKITAIGCAAVGGALTVNLIQRLMQSEQPSSGVLTIPFLLKVSITLSLFSSAHAFAFDYKPKTSRPPFGHTSSKEVITGLAMLGTGILLINSSQVSTDRNLTPYFWLKTAMTLFSSAALMYVGAGFIIDGFGLSASKKLGTLPNPPEQDKSNLPDQPICLKVQATSSLETLGNSCHRVWHIPDLRNADAITDPSLKTIDALQIFKDGTVAFGFGKPNVFLMRIEGGLTQRVDAKSLWRDSTKITTSDENGKVQSGIFLIPRNLDIKTTRKLEEAAQEAVGTTGITCAQTNAVILEKAGFSFGNGTPISTSILPHDLLKNILNYGLTCNNKSVDFDIVCTTKDSNLAAFHAELTTAVLRTPCRHAERKSTEHDKDGKKQRAIQAQQIHDENAQALRPTEPQETNTSHFTVWASKPSAQLGSFARGVWGPHVVYRIKFTEVANTNDFLSEPLHAFPQTNPSILTRIKRDILFCPPSLRFIGNNIAPAFDFIDYFSEKRLLELLQDGEKRNIVLTQDELVLVHIGKENSYPDWMLSKHVLAASVVGDFCPKDGRGFPMVRFAGELWYDSKNNTLQISANSGTFIPKPEDLKNAVAFAKKLLPTIEIVEEVSNEMCARP